MTALARAWTIPFGRGRQWTLLAALPVVAACAAPVVWGRSGSGPAPLEREPATGMELVHVKGGCFPMGDVFGEGDGYSEETPVHEVCLEDFYIGRYEVTRAEWRRVMGSDPSRDAGCTDDRCPVDGVGWSDAQAFVARLNAGGGDGRFRLPTEAEWEFAARSGGRREKYSGGSDVAAVAWFAENSGRRNHPVGTRAPNGLGIHDMSGNVWEWTGDWYAPDYYARSPRVNPRGPDAPAGANVDHVIRGGCRTGEAANERTSRRSTSRGPSDKVGFRVARSP